MKKRILSICLVIALLFGILVLPQDTRAASSMTTSDQLVDLIKAFEGFSAVPYLDSDGKYTIGYGTRCPDELVAQYQETPMTTEQAEAELRAVLITYETTVNQFIDKHGLNYGQQQFDALVSLVYNVGGSWLSKGNTLVNALTGGATGNELIYAFSIYSMSGGVRSVGHVRRRLAEAAIFLEGSYSRTAPDKYCYVLYDAQGGKISAMGGTYNVQGYDGNLTAELLATATRSGYTFKGWFTEKTGGKQVTVLDMTTKGATLYARWESETVEDPTNPTTPSDPSVPTDPSVPEDTTAPTVPSGEPITPVKVSVTVSALNIRKGPGASYQSIGMASKGDTYTVTAIYQGSDYLWGKIDAGWIALENTDYGSEPDVPPVTDPTVPPVTDPTTEPTTKPVTPPTTAPTAPPTTAPTTPTVPEEPIPEGEPITPVQVKVTVSALHIRKGPGEDYASLGFASSNEKYTVTAIYQGENYLWGKTESGWIALENTDYSQATQSPEQPTEPDGGNQSEIPEDPEMPPEGMALYATVVNTGSLNVRHEPAGTVISTLHLGDRVQILEQKYASGGGLWGRFENGWISLGGYVTLETVPVEEEQVTPPVEELPPEDAVIETPEETVKVYASVVHTGSVPVYSQPKGESCGSLAPGDRVELSAMTTVDGVQWAKCAQGWIRVRAYVKLETVSVEPEQAEPDRPVLEQTGLAITVTATAIEESGASLLDAPGGAAVAVLDNETEAVLTQYQLHDGVLWGFCAEGWLRLDEQVQLATAPGGDDSPVSYQTVTIQAARLNLRSEAGNNATVVCRLTQGMTLEVEQMQPVDGTIWALTDLGWLNMDYVTRIR